MNVITLSRLQFALTAIYHFFFVPLTLGLSILVALMETRYVRTGDALYKRMAQFWGKLFLINFALGVVTGIVMEFQFGMNWSEYSRFVGDVFGAPLAIESLSAFFLESTFLGIWIFGWERLSKRMHAATIWLVAIGSNLSAFWILLANSFMQEPVGYMIRNGRAEMTDFFALLTNPHIFYQFPHVIASGLVTASFFILGISAYHLFRDRQAEIFRVSFRWASIAALIAMIVVIVVGHAQGIHVYKVQPMKMAATESLMHTQDPAPWSLFAITRQSDMKEIINIRIPKVLSFLYFGRLSGEVKGIVDLQAEYQQLYGPGDYVPPIMLDYWSFRIMVGAGFLLALLAAIAVYLSWLRKRVGAFPIFLRLLPFAVALPYIANTCGWLLAETGRQPWIIYGVLRTQDAVSATVTGGMVLTSLIAFAVVYASLMAADVYLLTKFAAQGPETPAHLEPDLAEPVPSGGGE
jgi:cytochrome d ubiquinol oxidase subunit I